MQCCRLAWSTFWDRAQCLLGSGIWINGCREGRNLETKQRQKLNCDAGLTTLRETHSNSRVDVATSNALWWSRLDRVHVPTSNSHGWRPPLKRHNLELAALCSWDSLKESKDWKSGLPTMLPGSGQQVFFLRGLWWTSMFTTHSYKAGTIEFWVHLRPKLLLCPPPCTYAMSKHSWAAWKGSKEE